MAAIKLLFIGALLLAAGCGTHEKRVDSIDLSVVEPVLREGDLAFRRGYGITSRAVLTADRGAEGIYSHVGIVVRWGEESEWKIVHIVPGEPAPDGTKDVIKTEGVESFFAPERASRGAVMRMDAVEATAGAAKEAKRLSATGLAFDHGYDLTDTTRMYCTELIYNVFARAGIDITEGRRTRINAPGFSGDYILPTDIARYRNMKTVYEF